MGVSILMVLVYYLLPMFLLLALTKFLYKVWWKPIHIRTKLASQGIKGPPYKFLHGNTKEIFNMLKESRNKPIEDLSHDIFPKLLPFTHLCIKTYGKVYLSWYGPTPQLNITEPELIKEVFNNRDGVFVKKKAQGFIKKLLGDGLVTTQGRKWAKQRKIANHAFHAESLKGMVPAMIASVESMLERWKHEEGKEIEVLDEYRVLTSEIISRTAFGSSYVEGKNIFEMLMKLTLILSANSFKIRFPGIGKFWPTKDEIEANKIEQEIQKNILEIIKRRKEKMKKGEVDGYGSDYLGLLVKANKDLDESKRVSIEDMIDECKTFYIAGHETTTSLLTWTCLLLAINIDWQDKARAEVMDSFGSNNPTPDDIWNARLKTMNMIINETLRLYIPVPSITRTVSREVRLGKYTLPPNIDINMPIIANQHDPEIWGEDVLLFKPERFSEGVVKATNNNPAVYLPFGLGPRSCVGMNFAVTETKIALAMILQRYHFTLSPAYVHSPSQRLTTQPQHGLQIILHAV